MAVVDAITALVQPWASLYSDHQGLATAVIATHVLSMFVGGGMAIAADRSILRFAPGTADAVRAIVADLATTHSVVLFALVLTIASGAVLAATDVPTFSASVVYWTKMTTLVALLLNGLRMRRAERGVMEHLAGAPIHTAEMPVRFPRCDPAWRRVRQHRRRQPRPLAHMLVTLGVVLSNS